MTGQEKRRWSELVSGAEWQEFVDKFWESRNPKPGNPDNTFKTGFDRRVAFADANFVQAEGTRGSMTDRGMVFVLLGPPTYVGRRPIRTGEDANEAEGMSSVGSTEAGDALKAARNEGKLSGHKAAAAVGPFTGPGAQALEASANWREIWHYRKELLPKGVRFLQVDIEFITKKGYGVNVLQRDPRRQSRRSRPRAPPPGQNKSKNSPRPALEFSAEVAMNRPGARLAARLLLLSVSLRADPPRALPEGQGAGEGREPGRTP